MFKILLSLFFLAATYTPMTPDEAANFQKQLYDALTKGSEKIDKILAESAASGKILTVEGAKELDEAKRMIEVKNSMITALLTKESLRSPAVRTKLLQLLSQSSVSNEDITEFQNLINQEKVKIQAFDAATETPPASQK